MGVMMLGHSQPPIGTMTSTSATAPDRSRARAGAGHGGDSRVDKNGVSKPASSGKRGRGRPRSARKIAHREAPAYVSIDSMMFLW